MWNIASILTRKANHKEKISRRDAGIQRMPEIKPEFTAVLPAFSASLREIFF
jgi:hypothetical protein